MSSGETSLQLSLERLTMFSSTCSSSTTPSSPPVSPSTAPTTPAAEEKEKEEDDEERNHSAAGLQTDNGTPVTEGLPVTGINLPATNPAPTGPGTTAVEASTATTGPVHRLPLSLLERDYDPSRDDLPIEELLARPRLARSPYESLRKNAVTGRTMKPLGAGGAGASGAGASGASAENARRAKDLEMAKARLRAASVEMGQMKFRKKE